MENTGLSKHTFSFGLSLALCAVLNALLVVAKETSRGVSDWMQKLTGHHWITHVAMMLVLFAVFGWSLPAPKHSAGMPANRLTGIVCSGVVAGVLIVLAFYVIAD